ncbi:hypothetical protein AWM68_17215 [Fictibacillus phosphorivorans]|uniref:Uncharacterized protein n=1 Tax=Fictibacillus phosphorivorans TaxID=1221500 RepID=A0A163S3K9_9BACL|nr:hypothetical protein [Fictibacillus phosphorivorans]KZE68059.1 hypothetical protein AWM68_17215 [Fictibacillus phosphorivorans]
MAKKSGATETVTVEGIDYTLQHPGVRAGVQLRDRSKDMNGNMVEEKLYSELMKHVIVEPKVNWDTVEEIGNAAFTELMKEASTFLMG